MQFSWGPWLLAALLWNGGATAQIADPYRLPPSKQYIEPCRRAALALKPGEVERFRVVWGKNEYWFRFDIWASDGAEQKVFCDGAHGRIIRVEPVQQAPAH